MIDFGDEAYGGDVAGTDIKFTVERYWIDLGDHQIQTRQEVALAGGSSHPTGVIVAGLANRTHLALGWQTSWTEDCPYWGRTPVATFVWTDIGGVSGKFGSRYGAGLLAAMNPAREGAIKPEFRLELRRTDNQGHLARWRARFYDFKELYGGLPTMYLEFHGAPYPVHVETAKHGYYTDDTDTDTNQIHIGLDWFGYYPLPSCVIEGASCPAAAWQLQPISGPVTTEASPAALIQVYGGQGHDRNVCARAADTPCGCLHCGSRAALLDGRVSAIDVNPPSPGRWPARYYVHCTGGVTTGECMDWKRAFNRAADQWNAVLKPSPDSHFNILGSYDWCASGMPQLDVTVYGPLAKKPEPETGYASAPVGGNGATDGCGTPYWRRPGTMLASVNASRVPSEYAFETMTTWDWRSSPPSAVVAMTWVAAHELGHYFGLEHYGWCCPDGPDGSPPPPPTATPPPSGVHAILGVMIHQPPTPTPFSGYHMTPIDADLDQGGNLDAVECLLYRGAVDEQ